MSINIAAKRAKAAARRKQELKQRAKAALPAQTSLSDRVRLAVATAPVHACLLQGDLDDGGGMASVALARRLPTGPLVTAIFLIDLDCLGIKDLIVREMSSDDFDRLCDRLEAAAPVAPVDPALARKLVREAAAWAADLGFKPPPHFALAELLFGDADPDACDASFEFGRDGKPFYVPGPSETRAQIRERVAHLSKTLGPEGFDFMLPV